MYKSVKDIVDSQLEQDVVLEVPKDASLGHFATTIAFSLAKERKLPPKEIAKEIVESLQKLEVFSKVSEVNGFINLTLSDDFISQVAQNILSNEYSPFENRGVKILLEYVSANPTGPLHIGHARGAIIGDTLTRIGRYLGYEIVTEYYINDSGSQIDMLGQSVWLCGRELLGLEVEYPENFYRGEYVIDLTKEAIAEFGEEAFKDTGKIVELANFGLKKMLSVIKGNLSAANIYFDNYVSEKSMFKSFDIILEKLRSNNAIYEQDSKVWIKSSLKGDEKDRVIIRDNGEPTYIAGDIVYHNAKFVRRFDHYINIWGADHHGYIARIKASIDFLGFDSKKLEVILSQMVNLLKGGEPYKMSKRAGNFILMQDVLNDIGVDILRFVFLTKRSDTHLEFDVDAFKHEDANNPLYYINYANARIHTILDKSKVETSFDFSTLHSDWKDLLIYALMLNRILESAFEERALQKLPEYLKNLASKFHFCYNSHKILDSDDEGAIINVLMLVSLSITKGLGLMGIVAKTKM